MPHAAKADIPRIAQAMQAFFGKGLAPEMRAVAEALSRRGAAVDAAPWRLVAETLDRMEAAPGAGRA